MRASVNYFRYQNVRIIQTKQCIGLIVQRIRAPVTRNNVFVRFSYLLFSEREQSFVVCLSVVCNVRAPYSGGSNFPQYFYGIRYLGHPLKSTENFPEIVPGELLRRGS